MLVEVDSTFPVMEKHCSFAEMPSSSSSADGRFVCGAATEETMYVGCSANPWAPCCAGHLRQKNDE